MMKQKLSLQVREEIKRYSNLMRTNASMGLKDKLLYVQLEIKGQFWSNVVPHFSSASKIVLVNERS